MDQMRRKFKLEKELQFDLNKKHGWTFSVVWTHQSALYVKCVKVLKMLHTSYTQAESVDIYLQFSELFKSNF